MTLMREPDDHMLMAHADGQLDPAMTAEIEALLARDPVAREKVRRFRESADLARAAFDPVLDEPVPEALVVRVRNAARRSNVVPLRPLRRRPPLWSLPLAASIALAVGLSGGWWLGSAGTAPAMDTLSAVLERNASGETAVAGGSGITPASVFPATGDRWCRDFTRQDGGARAAGFACRAVDGSWQVEALLPDTDAGAYAPAAEEPSPLEAAIEAARAGPTLTADQEAALIARGWRSPSR
jgi:hypothetical protein